VVPCETPVSVVEFERYEEKIGFHLERKKSEAVMIVMTSRNSKVVFIAPSLNSAIMLLGISLGFLWKWKPDMGYEVMIGFMILSVLTDLLQLTIIRPRLELTQDNKALWIALAASPLIWVFTYIILVGGLNVLVVLFLEYCRKHGV